MIPLSGFITKETQQDLFLNKMFNNAVLIKQQKSEGKNASNLVNRGMQV